MFVGTVYCEFELSRSHASFDGFRFLLVEPDHEVDFEGPCVVVDTVDAQVGEMVIVALAPLGGAFDIPDDLPIHGAVVGVVGSMTAPADEEQAEEEDVRPRRRGGRGGDAPKREPARRESSRREAPKRESADDEADEKPRRTRKKKTESKRTSKKTERSSPKEEPEDAPAADEPAVEKKPRARKKAAKKTSKKASKPAESAESSKPAESSESSDDLLIVWEAPSSGAAGDTTKRKAPRRRR